MTNQIADISLPKVVKVAGFAYFLIIITSLASMIFIESNLFVPGNDAATFNNIVANEWLFRINAAYGLLMFASVVILAVALYVILKTVNKNLALLALSWRLGEAVLGCVTVLCSIIILLLINGKGNSALFETEQLHALVGLFLEIRSAAMLFVIVFLSLGTIVFSYLFLKSKYIPRMLAAFGIFSFLLMLIYPFLEILLPSPTAVIEIICFTPGTLFEVIIGLWLIFKGVNFQQLETVTLDST